MISGFSISNEELNAGISIQSVAVCKFCKSENQSVLTADNLINYIHCNVCSKVYIVGIKGKEINFNN